LIARGFKRLQNNVAFDLFEGTETRKHRGSAGCSANIFRKIFRREFRSLAENNGSLKDIAQFADVAGPGVRGEHAAHRVRKLQAGAMVNGTERSKQMIGEGQDVGAAFAQRRNRDGENVQPEEKIFAELAGSDGGREVGVRDGDKPRFDVKRFGAAEALECTLLQNAKQFCLRGGRKRGDFVEDDRAGATQFETAEFAVDSAGERAAFVAEEFAFDESGWKRSAIDFEIRRVAARTEFVNEARKMIFAGTGFTGDEKRGGGSGDFFREIEQAARSGVFGDPGKAVRHGSIVAR